MMMEKNMLLVTSWLNPKLILWFLKSRPHFSLISQTYLILKANRYIALSFSGCLWFTPFLGESMFIWFCYCDTLKVWYYKLGFGAKKTMKIKVSVNMQDAFLVVTELFSPQSRSLYKSCKSPSVFWKMTIFQTSFLYPLLILWQGLYFLMCLVLYRSVFTAILSPLIVFLLQNGQTVRFDAQFSPAWNSFV